MSVLRSHNNKTRGGLGRVCATGMYRSTEHVKFPKFQTGIFVEWKAPIVLVDRRLAFGMDWTSGWDTDQDLSKLIIPWDQG